MHDPRSRGFAFIDILPPSWGCCSQCGNWEFTFVGQLPQLHPFLHQVQICLLLLLIINRCKSKSVISIVRKEKVKFKTVYTNILNGT
jgi:hypothetical protein